jgi:hypothetical protein
VAGMYLVLALGVLAAVYTSEELELSDTAAVFIPLLVSAAVPPVLYFALPSVVITELTRTRVLLNVLSALPLGALLGLLIEAA